MQARAFYLVITISILVGVAMDFIGVSPIRALYLAAILNGVAAPPLLVLIALLARSGAGLGVRAAVAGRARLHRRSRRV
jgi:hypothetical protein